MQLYFKQILSVGPCGGFLKGALLLTAHFLCENERQPLSCVKTFHLLCHVKIISHFSAETSPVCREAAMLTLTRANSLGCAALAGPAAAGLCF